MTFLQYSRLAAGSEFHCSCTVTQKMTHLIHFNARVNCNCGAPDGFRVWSGGPHNGAYASLLGRALWGFPQCYFLPGILKRNGRKVIGTQAFLYSWRGKEGEDKGKEIVSVYIAQTTELCGPIFSGFWSECDGKISKLRRASFLFHSFSAEDSREEAILRWILPPLGVHCAVVAKVQTLCGAVCRSLELEEGTKGRQRKGCTVDSILRKVWRKCFEVSYLQGSRSLQINTFDSVRE